MNKKLQRPNDIEIENAQIKYRNFAGAAGQYNAAGNRNFSLFLDPEQADELTAQGWNIKCLLPKEEGDLPQCHMKVDVGFKEGSRPPRIVLITSSGKRYLDAETVQILDYADIEHIDMILNPYVWEINGKSGVKAFLKAMYVTIREDQFEKKYADIPDSGMSANIDETHDGIDISSDDRSF